MSGHRKWSEIRPDPDRSKPVGMRCPGCDEPPAIALGDDQVFCGNLDCHVLHWNPMKSLDELMDSMQQIDTDDWGTS